MPPFRRADQATVWAWRNEGYPWNFTMRLTFLFRAFYKSPLRRAADSLSRTKLAAIPPFGGQGCASPYHDKGFFDRLPVILIAVIILSMGCARWRSGVGEQPGDLQPTPEFEEILLEFEAPELGLDPPAEDISPDAPIAGMLTNETPNMVSRTTIQPGLVLAVRVEVKGRREIEENSIRVSETGVIRLPFLGAVEVTDRTLAEAQDRLTELYSRYYVNPRVEIEFASQEARPGVFPWGRVTVLGQVSRPGEIGLPPTRQFSLVGAIQAAGGFASSANKRSIRITCPNGNTRRVSMRDIGRGDSGPEDILLTDGYIIYIPERIF